MSETIVLSSDHSFMIYLTCQPFLATSSDLHPSLGVFPVGSHHQLTVIFLRSLSASEAMWHKSEMHGLWLYCLLIMLSWVIHWPPCASVSSSIRLGVIIVHITGLLCVINELIYMKHLEQCWASAKKCYYFYFGISFTFFFHSFLSWREKKSLFSHFWVWSGENQ